MLGGCHGSETLRILNLQSAESPSFLTMMHGVFANVAADITTSCLWFTTTAVV